MDNYLGIFISKFGEETKEREGNGTESRHICPKCQHNALSCGIYKGLCFCYSCGFKYALTPKEKKDVVIHKAKEKQVTDPKKHLEVAQWIVSNITLLDSHKKYILDRGLVNYPLGKLGSVTLNFLSELQQTFDKETLILSGFMSEDGNLSHCLDYRKLIIPYWFDDKIITIKSRDLNGQGVKYLNPKGTPIGSYPYFISSNVSQVKSTDVIITEGELCALSAYSAGIIGIGLPGKALTTSTRIQKNLFTALGEIQPKRIFINLDTDIDEDANLENEKLVKELGKKLKSYRYNCYSLVFPKENTKMDLDLFLLKNPASDLYELMDYSRKL